MGNQKRARIENVVGGSADSRIILMSGAPGSGKSTLARKLAEALRFTLIERDTILETYWQQAKLEGDDDYNKNSGIPRYFALLETIIADGQDLVIDGTLYAGKSDIDMPKVCSDGRVVNIHTQADGTIERFVEREKRRNGGVVPDWVEPHKQVLEDIHEDTSKLLEMGMPALTIVTNDGYDPGFDEIIRWIREEHEKLRS